MSGNDWNVPVDQNRMLNDWFDLSFLGEDRFIDLRWFMSGMTGPNFFLSLFISQNKCLSQKLVHHKSVVNLVSDVHTHILYLITANFFTSGFWILSHFRIKKCKSGSSQPEGGKGRIYSIFSHCGETTDFVVSQPLLSRLPPFSRSIFSFPSFPLSVHLVKWPRSNSPADVLLA